MTLRNILLPLLFFVIPNSYAQPPAIADSIMAIKKKWKKTDPFVGAYDPQLKPAHFPLIYKKADSIAALVQQAYPEPTGTEATWHVSILGKPYFSGGPSPYVYSSMFKYYYYNKGLGKILRHEEPGTGVSVYVNAFRFLLDDSGLEAQIQNKSKKIYKLLQTDGEWKGYPVYRVDEAYAGYKNYRTIFLGKNGNEPWKTVTRLEYLESLRSKWRADAQKAIDDLEDGLVKGKKMIEQIRNDKKLGAEMKEKIISTAQATYDKQAAQKEITVRKAREMVEKDEKKIDEYINSQPAGELQLPAVISSKSSNYSWQFVEPGKKAYKLVYIDESYFDKSLPSYMPQFFTVTWTWMDDIAPLYFKKQFEENFPLEKLQAMLDRNTRIVKK